MTLADDDLPRNIQTPPGGDLSGLSVAELEQRLETMRAEILRIESEISRKTTFRSQADALFGR